LFKELKKLGSQVIGVWTSGKMDGYIPTWMENNINCLMILEQQAGIDPIKLRQGFVMNCC